MNNTPIARVMLKSEGQKLECALAKLREENLRLKRHLIFQDDADKDPQAVYDVVRRDKLQGLEYSVAAMTKERDQLREQYNTLVTARRTALDILGGQP